MENKKEEVKAVRQDQAKAERTDKKLESVRESATKSRRFIQEFVAETGRIGPLIIETLPDMTDFHKTVVLPRESLVRFRNNYLLLLEFAAEMCKKPMQEVTPFDLSVPFFREVQELMRLEDEDDIYGD